MLGGSKADKWLAEGWQKEGAKASVMLMRLHVSGPLAIRAQGAQGLGLFASARNIANI